MSDFDVIIMSGGKTGSTSLKESFSNAGYKTIHVHSNQEYKVTHKNLISKYPNLSQFIDGQQKNKIYIIDSYRNPIERAISSFFQNIKSFIGYDYHRYDNLILMYYFNKFLLNNIENYHPLDIERPALSDVDFCFRRGCSIKYNRNKIYIKLRFKDIERWSSILSKIFKQNIQIVHANIGSQKDPRYQLFKAIYKLPRSYFNKLDNDKIFAKYNTLEEINEYKNEWMLKSEDDNVLFNNLNNIRFKNVPVDFNVEKYIENNPIQLKNYNTPIEAKIHYELFGHKQKLSYK